MSTWNLNGNGDVWKDKKDKPSLPTENPDPEFSGGIRKLVEKGKDIANEEKEQQRINLKNFEGEFGSFIPPAE